MVDGTFVYNGVTLVSACFDMSAMFGCQALIVVFKIFDLGCEVVLGFCPVALLKFWSPAVSGPCTPLTGSDDCLKSGYEGVRDNRDFGQALLVA